jgi:hypothetical protein
LAFRILDTGFNVIYSGEVAVKHLFDPKNREPWRKYYFDTRNQFWLAARNYPISYMLVYLSRGLFSMLIYSIRDGYFWYWAKAIIDGLAGLKKAIKQRKVLSQRTINIVRLIDSKRPGLGYMIRKKVLDKSGFFR